MIGPFDSSAVGNRPLSKRARRLTSLGWRVLCRDQAEVEALGSWVRRADGLKAGWQALFDGLDRTREATGEALRVRREAVYAHIISMVGGLMGTLKRLDHGLPNKEIPAVVWGLHQTISMVSCEIATNLPDPEMVSVTDLGDAVRNVLAAFSDPFDLEGERSSKARTLLLDLYRSMPTDELALLAIPFPLDSLVSFLGLSGEQSVGVFLTAKQRRSAAAIAKKASARANSLIEEHRAFTTSLVSRAKALAKETEAIIDALPDTGEIHGFRSLLTSVNRMLADDSVDLEREISGPDCFRLTLRMALGVDFSAVEWSKGSREVLAELITHPKNFNRYCPTAEDAKEAKRQLRGIRELFIGHHPVVEQASLLAALSNEKATSEEICWMLAEYLMARQGDLRTNPLMRSLVEGFAKEFTGLYPDNAGLMFGILANVRSYSGEARLRTQLDVEVEQLAQEEPVGDSNAEAFAAFVPYVPKTAESPVIDGTAPITKRFRLLYVLNPESPTPKTIAKECDSASVLEGITSLLRDYSNPVEPVDSLARAVYHHAFELTEEHRMTWVKEKVGTFNFHKLKRGRARIYVRLEDSVLTFHSYARKDWSHHRPISPLRRKVS